MKVKVRKGPSIAFRGLLVIAICALLWNQRGQRLLICAVEVTNGDVVAPSRPAALNARLPPFKTMPENIERALAMILRGRRDSRATFVQIGANDGQMYDPLYPHTSAEKSKWIGLQVEPQPELYSKVAVLHADAPDWAFYHGALATAAICVNGSLPFCETKTPGVGGWQTQGQINTVALDRCNTETMQIRLRPCVTSFEDLIGNHASPVFLKHALDQTNTFNLDLLQIDVEGNDYDVLKLINWDILHPQCIHYEHFHLKDDEPKARELLTEKGYTMIKRKMDVLACQVEAEEKSG